MKPHPQIFKREWNISGNRSIQGEDQERDHHRKRKRGRSKRGQFDRPLCPRCPKLRGGQGKRHPADAAAVQAAMFECQESSERSSTGS